MSLENELGSSGNLLQKDKQTKLSGEFMKWENITQHLLENH